MLTSDIIPTPCVDKRVSGDLHWLWNDTGMLADKYACHGQLRSIPIRILLPGCHWHHLDRARYALKSAQNIQSIIMRSLKLKDQVMHC